MTYLSEKEYYLELGKGNVSGATVIQKFGALQTGNTTWTPVSSSGTYATPTAATALELVSTDNTNDIHPDNTAGRTGAHLVRIYGLKTPASTAEETEDIKLNGTTAVALASSWWRIYRMQVVESGSYATSAGSSHNSTISVQETGGGAVWAEVAAVGGFGLGQSEIGCYSIPVGKTVYIMVQHVDVAGTKDTDIAFFVRENADDVTTPFSAMQVKVMERNIPAGTEVHLETKGPLLAVTGPADMGWMAKAASASGSVDVEVDFEIIIY